MPRQLNGIILIDIMLKWLVSLLLTNILNFIKSQTLLNFKQPELVNGEWHLTNVSWPINSSEEFYSFYGAYRQSFLI